MNEYQDDDVYKVVHLDGLSDPERVERLEEIAVSSAGDVRRQFAAHCAIAHLSICYMEKYEVGLHHLGLAMELGYDAQATEYVIYSLRQVLRAFEADSAVATLDEAAKIAAATWPPPVSEKWFRLTNGK